MIKFIAVQLGMHTADLEIYPYQKLPLSAVIMLARKHRAWDPVNDIVLFVLAAALVSLALWVNADMLGML